MSTDKPNILFLFSDQFNARCLSCSDHPDVQTPNLDRLARDGVRFENAYAQSPICTPSRMSFLSGLYPSTHAYYGLYGKEPEQKLTSMFEYFSEHGYRTGALGKLHTPRYWIEQHCQFVYDEFVEYPKYLEGAGFYQQNDNRRFTGWKDGQPSDIPLDKSCEVALAQQTIRFLRNQGEPADRGTDDAPWFAWVSFSRPHSPLTPSEPFASMYPPESVTLPPSADPEILATQPNRIREVPRTHQPPAEGDIEVMLSAYLGLVSQVDYGIGLILDELEQQGILDNTIIVFTSDHGDYAGEHGLWSKIGGISSRAITRIPMIISYPAHIRPSISANMIEAIDLFPTLCDLAQIPIPDHTQGTSFKPILEDARLSIRGSALTENVYRKALATPEWRYIANTGTQPDELYNIIDDPWEMNNLIDHPDHQQLVQDLLRTLFKRAVEASRPVTMFDGGQWKHVYDRDGRTAHPLSYEDSDSHL